MANRTTGQRRYLTTNSAQTAFEITAGRKTLAAMTAENGWFVPSSGTFKESQKLVLLGDYRGVRIQMFGTGADNATANYRIWIARAQYSADAGESFPSASKVLDVDLVPWIADTSTATLSTLTGVTGAAAPQILASERIADTLTGTLSTTATTPPGPAAVIEASYGLGVTGAYSPAANASPAELCIPDFGAGVLGFIIEWDMAGGTPATNMNALYELTR